MKTRNIAIAQMIMEDIVNMSIDEMRLTMEYYQNIGAIEISKLIKSYITAIERDDKLKELGL